MASTKSNPKYYRQQILGTVFDSEYGTVIDPLSQILINMCDQITSWSDYTWRQDDVFTTVVYAYYQNTSLWWFVLAYNGLFTPFDLQPGMVLRFPVMSQINAVLVQAKLPPIGRVVVI